MPRTRGGVSYGGGGKRHRAPKKLSLVVRARHYIGPGQQRMQPLAVEPSENIQWGRAAAATFNGRQPRAAGRRRRAVAQCSISEP